MRKHLVEVIANLTGKAVVVFAQLVTAVRANWQGIEPMHRKRVYYANHRSHGDFVLIWTVLPTGLRKRTRPVAGSDYWLGSKLRSFIGQRVFNAELIDRVRQPEAANDGNNPVEQMAEALLCGDSLILFPEGTRNTSEETILPFKSGLYHLANAVPDAEVVPVWIDNLNHVMPKGEFIPVPLICTVTFGAPLGLITGESKSEYLQRARESLLALKPQDRVVTDV